MATQVLHAPPSPSPSSRTATGRFHDTCIEWLRDHEQLHTRVLPGEHIPVDDDGFARVRGHLVASSRTGAIAFAGLVALVASWLLLELGDRLARLEVGPTVVALGWALVVAGVFALRVWNLVQVLLNLHAVFALKGGKLFKFFGGGHIACPTNQELARLNCFTGKKPEVALRRIAAHFQLG